MDNPDGSTHADLTAAEQQDARNLFADFNCGACHALAAVEGDGALGPSLDGNVDLTIGGIVQIVAQGGDGMPAYGATMSEEEISLLARYIIAEKE